jgi:hypothetical protein
MVMYNINCRVASTNQPNKKSNRLIEKEKNLEVQEANSATDALNRLELSRDYQIKNTIIWKILRRVNFYWNVDLF